jgi:large subunit ribosomal protein LP1
MPFTVSDAEKAELLCTYAALILNDDKVDITDENISKLVAASGATIEPYWPKLFAGLLAERDVDELLLSGGAGGPSSGGAAGGAAAAAGDDAAEAEPEEESESESESDADMGFSLFDD